MVVIAGLGNPDKKYEKTRHNVGFDVIDAMAKKYNVELTEKKHRALCGSGYIAGQKVLLVKPQTYMNLSGESIQAILNFYKLDAERDLLVIYDDISLAPGRIRVRAKGSAGGHNGIKSLIAHIGSEKFGRVRIGVGRPLPGWSVINHVLAPFSDEDVPKIREAIEYLLPAMECIVREGYDMAMNKYNPKKEKKKKEKERGEGENG